MPKPDEFFQERKGLQQQEVIRCESCGKFHPVDECTELVIKIVVGKNCDINNINLFSKQNESIKNEIIQPQSSGSNKAPILNEEPIIQTAYIPPQTKKKTVIPPGIAQMMVKDGSTIRNDRMM